MNIQEISKLSNDQLKSYADSLARTYWITMNILEKRKGQKIEFLQFRDWTDFYKQMGTQGAYELGPATTYGNLYPEYTQLLPYILKDINESKIPIIPGKSKWESFFNYYLNNHPEKQYWQLGYWVKKLGQRFKR